MTCGLSKDHVLTKKKKKKKYEGSSNTVFLHLSPSYKLPLCIKREPQ